MKFELEIRVAELHVHIHQVNSSESEILAALGKQSGQLNRMEYTMAMTKQEFLTAQLATNEQIKKVAEETRTLINNVSNLSNRVSELLEQLANGTFENVPQELIDAQVETQAQLKIVDDLVPDAPAPTE